jgi:hypothetical protein
LFLLAKNKKKHHASQNAPPTHGGSIKSKKGNDQWGARIFRSDCLFEQQTPNRQGNFCRFAVRSDLFFLCDSVHTTARSMSLLLQKRNCDWSLVATGL